MRDLTLSAEQDLFASSVHATIDRHGAGPASAGDRLWAELGALGLLGVGTPSMGGTCLDLIAGMRAAGAAGCLGPFIGAVLGARWLPEIADAVVSGTAHISVVGGGLAAWSLNASAHVELTDEGVPSLVEITESVPIGSLTREPWARVSTQLQRDLNAVPGDLAAAELTRAAWIVGAGHAAVDHAADHARERVQFGRRIGEFQAVAHQLADALAEIGAAWDAVVVAAWHLELDGDATPAATATIAATRAGLAAAYASHQVHGALGYTTEMGLDRLSAGIRQISLHPPSPRWREQVALFGGTDR